MSNQVDYTVSVFNHMRDAVAQFMEEYQHFDLSDVLDRELFVDSMTAWCLKEKTVEMTPEQMLPRAKYRVGINIVNELSGERIVKLLMDRPLDMSDTEFLQLQNWFWATIGRAVRDNKELAEELELGGVSVIKGEDN